MSEKRVRISEEKEKRNQLGRTCIFLLANAQK